MPLIWPLDGCKWSPFAINVRGAGVRAAQAGGYRVTVKRGSASPAVKLSGRGGAPLVRVSGPGGQTLDSTNKGLDLSPGGKIRILRYSTRTGPVHRGRATEGPARHLHDLDPSGSVPVTSIAQPADPPAARVRAKLSGKGSRRVLTYSVRRRKARRSPSSRSRRRECQGAEDHQRRARQAALLGAARPRHPADRGAVRAQRHRRRGAHRGAVQAAQHRAGPDRGLKLRRKGTRVAASWKRSAVPPLRGRRHRPTRGKQRFRTVRTPDRGAARRQVGVGHGDVRAVAPYRQGRMGGARSSASRDPQPVQARSGAARSPSARSRAAGAKSKARTKAKSRPSARKKR